MSVGYLSCRLERLDTYGCVDESMLQAGRVSAGDPVPNAVYRGFCLCIGSLYGEWGLELSPDCASYLWQP